MPRLLSKRIVFDVKKVLMLYSENIQYAIIIILLMINFITPTDNLGLPGGFQLGNTGQTYCDVRTATGRNRHQACGKGHFKFKI